jgi:hypothetical protein
VIVKPAPGVKVRHPVTRKRIPETGIEVPSSDTYWARRLRSGDVVEVHSVEVVKASDEEK